MNISAKSDFPTDLRTVHKADGTDVLSPAGYTAIFKYFDITPQKPTITYCNTGHLAAGSWFVISEAMQNPNARLYDGSMYEWTTEHRPVVGVPH